MPGGDRTGPLGAGAMTGRGVGLCSGFSQPGFANARFSRGRGMGQGFNRGGGRGRRNRFFATGLTGRARGGYLPYADEFEPEPGTARKDELAYLRRESKLLRSSLESINKRIEELEKE